MKIHSMSGVLRKSLLLSFCVIVGCAALAQTVVLRPIDTGRSAVTFNLGGMAGNTPGVDGRYVIKTNLLYAGAALAPNLAFELALGGRTSVEIAAGFNDWDFPWDSSDTGPEWDINNNYKTRLRHVIGKAQFRFWFRNRFAGHFVGTNLFYGNYNVGDLEIPLLFEREFHYEGNVRGAALSYGWLWRWNHRWGMEFNIDAGFAILRYRKSFIEGSTEAYSLTNTIEFRKNYLGPTGAGIKLVFTIN